MTHEYILWISLFAYALHIYEETVMDWKTWAESVSGFKNIQWVDFFVANAAVIVAGVCTAMVGWQMPSFGLLLPALQLINGLFFHLIPTIYYRRLSPGVITACLFFFPVGLWAYWGALTDGILSWSVLIASLTFACLLMTAPFVFLKLRDFTKI